MLILAFPPFGLWPFIWVGFLPMLVAQFRVLPPRLSGLASSIALGTWLGGYLTPIFAGSGLYITWLPLAIAGISYLTDSGVRAFHERTGYRWFVPYGALSWVGFEMIRGFIPIMGTWGFVANTLYGQPWLIQPVSIFSIFGLSLLIMVVNYGMGLGALYLFDRRWRFDPGLPGLTFRTVGKWVGGVVAALFLWVGLSLTLYRSPTTATVRVAALHYDAGSPPWRAVDRFSELTRWAAQEGARLVVWPEVAIQGDPQVTDTERFRRLAAETDAYLVLGYIVPVSERLFRNEATVLSPQGEWLGVYGKDHPVVFAGETSFTRGIYPVYETPLGRIGTIICYDLDFTDTARRLARKGAQLLLVPSHDWPQIATKHYTHLVFRAVENRVSLVKADSSGNDSAVIDPYGRILAVAVTPGGDRDGQVVVADVPLGEGDSVAVRLGDWVGWVALVGMVFFMIYDLWTKTPDRRRKGSRLDDEAPESGRFPPQS
ncbi:apolipoprotein N-acyltransferase [Thermus caldifontis]|uniref:apolipoprotein N-acyltransferase n=1 Tax=Thermus caldifontis TaxID=1930763 RepID=UPI0013B3DECD|nr:carbon-nitrogen hydrolase family protein [Thermus caldifontis]